MEEVRIFNNPMFGDVRTILGNDGEPRFCLGDVCKILGLTAKGVGQRLSDEVISNYPILDSIGRQQVVNFVNEDGLYDVILDSRKPEAKLFRKWVTNDVLPSIRKNGAYMTDDFIKEAMNNPDFVIEAMVTIKKEREAKEQALKEAKETQTLLDHKQEVVDGLTKDIPCDELRQRITQIIKEGGDGWQARWRLLYREFNAKYHMDIQKRTYSSKYASAIDYIDKELHMTKELYDLTCALFEVDMKKLVKRVWGVKSL